VKDLDYCVIATVSDKSGVALHRAVGSDGTLVLLEVLDPSRCSQRAIGSLANALDVASSLESRAIVKPFAIGTHHGLPTLVLENFDGEPCGRKHAGPAQLGPFLVLGTRIASALAEVHRSDIVHKNIEPHNILVHTATGEVRLTGFGLAARLSRESDGRRPARFIEGSLPYLSPEQTGRLQAGVDARADLYSLGIVLFELLTGELPFHAHDLVPPNRSGWAPASDSPSVTVS
jgi:serine/threonine protein kinase